MDTQPEIRIAGRSEADCARVARALRKRLGIIVDEMESCLWQREQAYQLAEAFLDEFGDLDAQRKALTRALWQLQRGLPLERAIGRPI
jgi:hypothetical protein